MGLGICHTCDAIILFGGIRRDGYHYCSRRCAEEAEMGRAVEMVPEEVAEQEAMRVRGDPCPDCGRADAGVDLRASHRCTGYLLHTSVVTERRICCRFCGARHALRAIAHSLLFGWWGFPLGPILTPIVVLRDLFVMIPRVRRSPSPALVEAVRLDIAAGVLAQGQLPPVPLLPSGD
ncbi:MAG: hypothetical protein GXY23_13000 [Myxococcales bacterium]|nr:hypothetical protein [Myxococcales bacterium]